MRGFASSTTDTGDQTTRLRRSVLFVPPRLERAVAVAKKCDADTIIFDLEDAVAPIFKKEARALLKQAIQEGGFGTKEVAIRCNCLGTAWVEDDISAIAGSGVHACVVPKVEARSDIDAVRSMLASAGAPVTMEVWAMVETPLGILQAKDIASAADNPNGYPLRALVVGSSDLSKELKSRHTPCRHPLVASLHLVSLAARAHGLLAIDGVHFDLDHPEEFEQHCRCLYPCFLHFSLFLLSASLCGLIGEGIWMSLYVGVYACAPVSSVATVALVWLTRGGGRSGRVLRWVSMASRCCTRCKFPLAMLSSRPQPLVPARPATPPPPQRNGHTASTRGSV